MFDEVVAGAVEAAKGFAMGDPAEGGTYLGPLAMPNQPAFLQAQVPCTPPPPHHRRRCPPTAGPQH